MENGSLTSARGTDANNDTGPGHKRSLSGPGGIFSRLPFLRSSSSFEESTPPEIPYLQNGPQEGRTPNEQKRNSAMARAMTAQKARKRKGSLRKTALLGTGRMRLERRSGSLELPQDQGIQTSPPRSRNAGEYNRLNRGAVDGPTNQQESRRFSFEDDITLADSETTPERRTWTLGAVDVRDGLKLETGRKSEDYLSPPSTVTSPIRSPTYASTTDDDDGLTFATSTALNSDLMRRRSSRSTHTKSQSLPHPTNAPITTRQSPPDHDYSTTASWGWIILIITWVVFVVGMGSCLGVWSWAWDVGETPYAPPELEDDPTLPIVGYYPALIVMTGVMAWVWVVVAWVGMKYFRHARYGEE